MTKYTMDPESAWGELDRFADAAGVELDERAEPGYEKPADADESEVADYHPLLTALRRGHMTVSDTGALTIDWVRPPGDIAYVTMDPGSWGYGCAMKAMSVGRPGGGKKKGTDDSKLGRMNLFLESLAGAPPGTIESLVHRRDVNLMVHLAAFLLSE